LPRELSTGSLTLAGLDDPVDDSMRYEKQHDRIVQLCIVAETISEVELALGLTTPNTTFRRYLRRHKVEMPRYLGQRAANRRSRQSRKLHTLADLREGSSISRRTVKRLLFSYGLKEEACERCGWAERRPSDGLIPLHLHHVNGDGNDNRVENLEVLCPNCHALTDNYGGCKNRRRTVLA
jgi:hypothetical protein